MNEEKSIEIMEERLVELKKKAEIFEGNSSRYTNYRIAIEIESLSNVLDMAKKYRDLYEKEYLGWLAEEENDNEV